MPIHGRVPHLTALSLAQTALECGKHGVPLEVLMEQCSIVEWTRDGVIDSFLRSDKQKLFMLDSDMVWNAQSFARLVAMSTMRDVVCGAYRAKRNGPADYQVSGSGSEQACDELGLLEIWGTGLGFTIIDRKVIEDLASRCPRTKHQVSGREMAEVFRVGVHEGIRMSEDHCFFWDIRALGYKVYVDPMIRLGHVGDMVWEGRLYDTLEQVNGKD